MAEDPHSQEEQQPAPPEGPDSASAPEDQSAIAQPAEEMGTAMGAAEVPNDAARAADADVSDGEVEAAMQEMLAASEKPPTSEAAGGENIAISTDEVEAAMQEVLTAAERPAAGGASSAESDAVAADESGPEARTTPDVSPPEPEPLPPNAAFFQAPDFSTNGSSGEVSAIDLLDDVELDVKIELGRTEMYIEDVLGLAPGSVVELDKAAGDPVDIFVNERLVARGEVLVLNDSFCVRINDILSPIPELEREE
jgi:flagellar motor switch protein FliN/FliY